MNAPLEALALRREAAAIKAEWDRGADPDARAALARRPELWADKSVVVDLAYEEFCRRTERGERPDPDAFCDAFPGHRQSVYVLVATHHLLAGKIDAVLKAPHVRWPEPGETLGDFRLGRELGRGAFARVYLAAEHSAGDRPVVVKLSAGGGAEGWTLGRLDHPNIVPVLSVRFEPGAGLTAVCMPFLGAATLTDLLDAAYPTADAPPPRDAAAVGRALRAATRPGDPPLPPPRVPPGDSYSGAVVRLAVQIADALAFLHGEGVCHRDLKPSNVLLGPGGRARLLDFNLAADARAGAPHLGGTYPYAAPELLRSLMASAEDPTLDERVDLFALGAILYELLSGRQPFGGPPSAKDQRVAAAEMFERHRAPHVPLRLLNPAVERGLARFIERCLAFDPAARPTAAAAAAALRRRLAWPARLRRYVARKPLTAAAMGGLALLAVAAAAGEAAARRPGPVAEYDLGREAFADGDFVQAAGAFRQALRDWMDGPPPAAYHAAHAAALLCEEADDDLLSRANLAEQDLLEANRPRPDGRVMALIGYCNSLLRRHDVAVEWYDRAAAAGFASAALYNNRGLDRTQVRFRLGPSEVRAARSDFDEALRLEPGLAAAWYNRAMLALEQRPADAASPPDDMALDDMERAAEAGPASQELYYNAARLFAEAARRDGPADPKGRAAHALRRFRDALSCGLDPRLARKDPALQAVLESSPEGKSLLTAPRRPAGPEAALRLVNPAPELPE